MIKWLKRLFHPKYDINLGMTYGEFMNRDYPTMFHVDYIKERKQDNIFVIKFKDCTKEYVITENTAGRCNVCPFSRGGWCALKYVYEIVPMRTTQVCRYATRMKDRPCGFTAIETLMEDI